MSGEVKNRGVEKPVSPYSPAFVIAMILGVGLNPVNSTLISTAGTHDSSPEVVAAALRKMLVKAGI